MLSAATPPGFAPPRLPPPAHAHAHARARAPATTAAATAPRPAAAAAGWALSAPATPRATSAASLLRCASRVARRFAKALAPRVDELAYAVEAISPMSPLYLPYVSPISPLYLSTSSRMPSRRAGLTASTLPRTLSPAPTPTPVPTPTLTLPLTQPEPEP